MSWQLANGYLVRCFLELEDLLVDEFTLFVNNEIWVERTLRRLSVWLSRRGTCPGQGDSGEATSYRDVIYLLTVSTLYGDFCGFRGESGSSNDDAGYSHKVGDACGIKIADRGVRCGGMEEQLMLGKLDILLRRIHDLLRALLQCCLELRVASTLLRRSREPYAPKG